MGFDPKDLQALAGALVSKGAPILGRLVGTAVGGPLGTFVGGAIGDLIPQIAQSVGLPADASPAVVASTVQAAPAAPDALLALEEKNKTDLALAQLQVDQNDAELHIEGPALLRFFYGGWRPAAGWLLCPIPAAYQLIASAAHLPLMSDGIWAAFLPVWVGIAGLRTYERYSGIALDTLAIKKK
jgi:hypothetical protein